MYAGVPSAMPSDVLEVPAAIVDSRERFRDTEVSNERVLPREQHVLRLDVAVHDAAIVRVCERTGNVAQDANDVRERKLASAREPCAQRLAVDERHRVVGKPVGLAGSEQRDDVRMLQPRGHCDLSAEALDGDGVRELGRQNLHYHSAAERLLGGDEYARHPAATELSFERVVRAERGLKLLPELAGFH